MATKVITIQENGLTQLNIDNLDELTLNIEANIQAQLVLTYTNCHQLNRQINVKENAKVNLLQINEANNEIINEEINLANNSNITCGYYELNDANLNLTTRYHLNGEEASAKIITSCITNAFNKIIDLECIHHVRNTYSEMENFAISHKGANYTIKACGTIIKGSKQAKSLQNTKVLTTSEEQKSEVIPLLLIDENDVVASHANSVGAMNAEHLYYLMSRGLNHDQATGLLTLSYVLPLTNVIDDDKINEQLTTKIRNQVGL